MRPDEHGWMERAAGDAVAEVSQPSRRSVRDVLSSQRAEILTIVRRHHGLSVAIFGSVARGEDHPGSDIDLLVDFEPGSSLFDPARISDELADLLGRPVDVVSSGGLTDRDDHIRREAVPL